MKKVRFVVFCGAAMSSGLIVDSMKKHAAEVGVELEGGCFASMRYREFDYGSVDIVLLAPQIKSQQDFIRKTMDEKRYKDVPIMIIPMRDYGLCHGKPILIEALKVLEEKGK